MWSIPELDEHNLTALLLLSRWLHFAINTDDLRASWNLTRLRQGCITYFAYPALFISLNVMLLLAQPLLMIGGEVQPCPVAPHSFALAFAPYTEIFGIELGLL